MGFFGGTIDRLRSPVIEGGDGGGAGLAGSIGGQVKTLAATYFGLYQVISSLTAEISRDKERRKAQFAEGIEGDRAAIRNAPNLGVKDLRELKLWAQQNQDSLGASTQAILDVAGQAVSQGLTLEQVRDFTAKTMMMSGGSPEIASGLMQPAVLAMKSVPGLNAEGALMFARQISEQSAGSNEAVLNTNQIDRMATVIAGYPDKAFALEKTAELFSAATRVFQDTSGEVTSKASLNILQNLDRMKLESSKRVDGVMTTIDPAFVKLFNEEKDKFKRLDMVVGENPNVQAFAQLLGDAGMEGQIIEAVGGNNQGPQSGIQRMMVTSDEFSDQLRETGKHITPLGEAARLFTEYVKKLQDAAGNEFDFNRVAGVINKATTTEAQVANGAAETAFEKGMANVDLQGLFADEIITKQMEVVEQKARMDDAVAGAPENTAQYKVDALDAGIKAMRDRGIPDFQEDLALMIKLRDSMKTMADKQFNATFPERQAAGRLQQNAMRLSDAEENFSLQEMNAEDARNGILYSKEDVAFHERLLIEATKELANARKEQAMLLDRLNSARQDRVLGVASPADKKAVDGIGGKAILGGVNPLGLGLMGAMLNEAVGPVADAAKAHEEAIGEASRAGILGAGAMGSGLMSAMSGMVSQAIVGENNVAEQAALDARLAADSAAKSDAESREKEKEAAFNEIAAMPNKFADARSMADKTPALKSRGAQAFSDKAYMKDALRIDENSDGVVTQQEAKAYVNSSPGEVGYRQADELLNGAPQMSVEDFAKSMARAFAEQQIKENKDTTDPELKEILRELAIALRSRPVGQIGTAPVSRAATATQAP
jgi:hypothetical protein